MTVAQLNWRAVKGRFRNYGIFADADGLAKPPKEESLPVGKMLSYKQIVARTRISRLSTRSTRLLHWRRSRGLPLLVVFCTVAVYRGAVGEVLDMLEKNERKAKDGMPRASVSFPPEMYRVLEDLAAKKKVSIAWVVREAVEKYLGDQYPLFGTSLLKEGQSDGTHHRY